MTNTTQTPEQEKAQAELRIALANTILKQMGGAARLSMMAGCKEFMALDSGVQFKVGRNAKGINKCRVILEPDDTYSVEFGAARRKAGVMTYTAKHTAKEVYCDTLVREFESATGMFLSF